MSAVVKAIRERVIDALEKDAARQDHDAAIYCACPECRDRAREGVWFQLGLGVLIFALGFVTACAVIAHLFFPTP